MTWKHTEGTRGIYVPIHNRGTRWWWVVKFTPGSHYPPGNSPNVRCTGGCVGPRAVLNGQEENPIPSPAFEPQTRQHVASRYTNNDCLADILICSPSSSVRMRATSIKICPFCLLWTLFLPHMYKWLPLHVSSRFCVTRSMATRPNCIGFTSHGNVFSYTEYNTPSDI